MDIEKMNPVITSILTSILASTVISSIISSGLTIINGSITNRRELKNRKKEELKRMHMEHLNPLKLYLIENHFRISVILSHIRNSKENKCTDLLCLETPKQVLSKDDFWFNSHGCFLISSCYLSACLFGYLNKVRISLPFFQFSKEDDAILLELSTKVSLGFLESLGIFYVTQFSIGNDVFKVDENRVVSYREFCTLLKDEKMSTWFYRLIDYYSDTGNGENLQRIRHTWEAIESFIEFLDKKVDVKDSLKIRYEVEPGGMELYYNIKNYCKTLQSKLY